MLYNTQRGHIRNSEARQEPSERARRNSLETGIASDPSSQTKPPDSWTLANDSRVLAQQWRKASNSAESCLPFLNGDPRAFGTTPRPSLAYPGT